MAIIVRCGFTPGPIIPASFLDAVIQDALDGSRVERGEGVT